MDVPLLIRKCILYAIFLYYLVVSLYSVGSPGLYYDEAFNTPFAVFLTNPKATAPFQYPGYDFHGFSLVSSLCYTGTLKSYFLVPFFYIFGPTIYAIRIPLILLGMAGLIFVYHFVKNSFGKDAALLTLLFLGTDIRQIFAHRHDYGPVAFMSFFKVASLFLFIKWWKTGRIRFLLLGALCLGLGVWDKASFLWFVFALAPAAVISYNKSLFQRFGKKELVGFSAMFAVGAFPFLLFNILSGGATFLSNIHEIGKKGLDIHLYIDQAYARMGVLTDVLSGNAIISVIFSTAYEAVANPIFPKLFAVSLIGNFLFFRHRNIRNDVFVTLLFFFIMLQIFVTLRARNPHHIMVTYPFPHIIVASFLVKLNELFREIFKTWKFKFFFRRLFLCGIILPVLFFNIRTAARFHQLLTSTGGVNKWSDTIYVLSDYLQENARRKEVICLDWGFLLNLETLTNGTVSLYEYYYDNTINGSYSIYEIRNGNPHAINSFARLMTEIAEKGNRDRFLLLRYSPEFVRFKNVDTIYRALLRQLGLKQKAVKIFYQRDNREVFGLYSLMKDEI